MINPVFPVSPLISLDGSLVGSHDIVCRPKITYVMIHHYIMLKIKKYHH